MSWDLTPSWLCYPTRAWRRKRWTDRFGRRSNGLGGVFRMETSLDNRVEVTITSTSSGRVTQGTRAGESGGLKIDSHSRPPGD
jgi:hypothetical protein